MDEALHTTILKATNSKKIVKTEHIQELWSGYGKLLRVFLDNGQSIIAKVISYPDNDRHPRGWSSNFAHERKKKSYAVETSWYQHYESHRVLAKTAKLLGAGTLLDAKTRYLLLEDLGSEGFQMPQKPQIEEHNLTLKWLANFHRHYLNCKPLRLWPIGSYWHLETRPHELEVMTDKELKAAAPLIDQKLNEANYKTIIHGDAKLANFLFREDQVAAVDFQYIGGGVGIKDVIYFLSSVLEESDLEKEAQSYLDYYFKILNLPQVEKEWRKLYPYAWCDFFRFLQGWSPGHWKIHSYSRKMREEVLKCL